MDPNQPECKHIKLVLVPFLVQMVRAHPLAAQSAQLQHLIAEAVAAQQGSQDLNPNSQVHSTFSQSKAQTQHVLLAATGPAQETKAAVNTIKQCLRQQVSRADNLPVLLHSAVQAVMPGHTRSGLLA